MAKVNLVALCEIIHAVDGVRETINPGDKFQVDADKLEQYPKGCYALEGDFQLGQVDAGPAAEVSEVVPAEEPVVEQTAEPAVEKSTKRKGKAAAAEEGDGGLI